MTAATPMHDALLREYEIGRTPSADISTLQAARPYLSSTLPVAALASGSVAALCGAVDRFRVARELPAVSWTLDPARIAASFSGDKMLRLNGEPVSGFAELSGFFRASDGWVRTHANYPHHRERLLAAVGLGPQATRNDLVAVLAGVAASEIEDRVNAVGGIAVRVRTESEWASCEPGRRAASGPLVSSVMRPDTCDPYLDDAASTVRPLAGVRVLDLTRVIAGPVATRALALLGATVVRVDSPHPAEIAWQHIENGQGKKTALLNLSDAEDRESFDVLRSTADVVVSGYRPGSTVDRQSAAPGAIRGRVSAWGARGPFGERRGFDSIVQAASGIALICHAPVSRTPEPGALPAQALDHASGYLLAAGIVDALAARISDGIGRDVSVGLARTAAWLLSAPDRVNGAPDAQLPGSETLSTHGSVTAAKPALAEYDDYPFPAHDWGSDAPRW